MTDKPRVILDAKAWQEGLSMAKVFDADQNLIAAISHAFFAIAIGWPDVFIPEAT